MARTPPRHPRQRFKSQPSDSAPPVADPPAPPAWLTRTASTTLADLSVDGPGRVLLTHPTPASLPGDPPLSIGAALSAALAGRTDNFVMVVGYFGHGGRSAYGGSPNDLHDPVALLLAELAEQVDRDDTDIKPRFSLLFGGISSRASALALELWWWLCRWRAVSPSAADAWRDQVLAKLPLDSSRDQVRTLIHAMLGIGQTSSIPLLDSPHPETTALLASATDSERTAHAAFEAKLRTAPLGRREPSPLAVQVGSLLLYLLQRRAEVRFGTQGTADRQARLFHPKLYVIERGRPTPDLQPDAFVFSGSANWSAVALDPSGGDANIEVASIHRVSGAPFSEPHTNHESTSLGADLAATARVLFDDANVFARWLALGDGRANVCDIALVEDLLRVPERFAERDGLYPTVLTSSSEAADVPDDPTPRPTPNANPRFAAALCRDIELALGLDAHTLDATVRTLHSLEHAWHGKIPSAYQLDGAARLLALLQHSRGALLTDEPGLGKTLVAQLVTAAMIHRRLVARRQLATELGTKLDQLPPLRVSILAPARVLGRSGRNENAATQWFRHAAEIRSAVVASFAGQPKLAELAAREDVVAIRLFSNQSLSRTLIDKDSSMLRSEVVDDLHHLACSELVVVDEAHNFRNGSGRATRLLRFCLSLPVWGESDWRVRQTAEGLPVDEPDAADIPINATGRKILLLSATPFNNRIQDVSTVLGHFAKAQYWNDRPGDLQDTLHRRVDDAPKDAGYWRRDKATKTKPTARADFERLLGVIAPKHIPGGRALDPDDIKAQKRAVAGTDQARARDGGPLYHWSGLHGGLGRIFAAVGETLAQEREGHGASRGVQLDTRARIDAMLLGYVVQRSRRQVLEYVERREGLDACAQMFRAPKQPRAPLPIRSRDADLTDHETQEREILEGLFSLVLATDDDQHERALSMLAYELRYQRGFDRAGATGARSIGAANFIAFQTINLVKRLQSCPYAFLMTLVRGMLRTNLYELALIEAFTRPSSSDDDTTGQQSFKLEEDRTKQLALARMGCTRVEEVLRERLDASPRAEQLRRLLGVGKSKRKATGGFFAELIDLDGDDKLAERFAADLELVRDYLQLGPHKTKRGKKSTKKRSTGDDETPAMHWVERLIEDLARTPEPGKLGSQIATDALACLDWVFGDGLPQGLLDIVYEGLDGWVGQPMAQIAEQITREPDNDKPIKWLEGRLRSDRRATDLLAWLLAQTAVRLAAERDPAARSLAPAGQRSLIFSEYADTIDYLRALLLALHRTCTRLRTPGAKPLPVSRTKQIKALLDDLRARVLDVCETLAAETRATLSSLGKTDPALFPAPIDPAEVAALVPSVDELARIALELVEHAAIVTSRVAGGERLLASSDASPSTDPLPETDYDDEPEQDPDAAGGTVDDAPALDAFSPWYQVDVTSADISGQSSEAVARRLADAQRRPVHTLLATEILAEGVNLQECGVAVHYDLPWNPTRLIQRNGRVDRRIDPQVERADARRDLAKRLIEGNPGLTIDTERFWPPRNVYHLTVPPIEPKLDDDRRTMFAKRVRAVLFDKLSGIRRLFGLSAWPVVLGAEDAAHVLDGSLAYETAAFRRREQLFLHWQALRAGLDATADFPTHGAFVCSLGATRLAKLHADLAETNDGLATDRVVGLALSYWSSPMPRSIPLRSGVDVAPFGTDDEPTLRAFAARWQVAVEQTGGVMALVQTHDELLAWRVRTETLPTKTQRTVLEACSIRPEQVGALASMPSVDWTTLGPADPATNTAEATGPSSPTTAAEVVLDHLARALLEDNDRPMLEELPAQQPWPASWARVTAHRRLAELIRRPLKDFPRVLLPAAASDIEPLGFNIIVTR